MLNKKKITKAWFKGLQDLICETVLELEKKKWIKSKVQN